MVEHNERSPVNQLRIGLCDDNQLYLSSLNRIIKALIKPDNSITVESLTPEELAACIESRCIPYDLLISDIDMGGYNGIDLASKINYITSSCMIIFISNFLNYATEVYDVNHVYFVLKSEADIRLPKALEKAISIYNERIDKSILVKFQNTEYRLSLADITYIEAMGRYLYIHNSSQSYKCIQSLKSILNELTGAFSRCHNSYLVNMKYIHSINRSGCALSDGTVIPISQTYAKSFQAAYIAYVSRELL
jgi:DNA-binding LytR/AlgR family response regulator